MEPHKLSSKTIQTIGDDLFEQYITNKDWLMELTIMMANVVIGEDKNEVPIFADNSETSDIRAELTGHISEKFMKLMLKIPERDSSTNGNQITFHPN